MIIFKPTDAPPSGADKETINKFVAKYYLENKQSFNLFKNICLLNVDANPSKARFFISLCAYIEFNIRLTEWESATHIKTVAGLYEDKEIDSVLYIVFNEVVHRYNKIPNRQSKFQDYVETNMLYGFRNWFRRHYHALKNVCLLSFNDDRLYDYTHQLFSDNQEIGILLDHYLHCLTESGATPMLLQIFREALLGNSLIQVLKTNFGFDNPMNTAVYKGVREHRTDVMGVMSNWQY